MIKYGSDERLCQTAHALGFKTYYDSTYIISQHTDINLGIRKDDQEDDFFRNITTVGQEGEIVNQANGSLFKQKGR